MVSVLSLYFYEMPSHHCPFCLLQKEYGYVGYPLYALLLCSTVASLGVAALHPFRMRESIARAIPAVQRKLALVSVLATVSFTAIVTWRIVTTSFRLG